QRALDAWSTSADASLERSRVEAEANHKPIEVRNELRGRLDAYQAMARRLGLLENRGVGADDQAARAARYTAPTDLMEAAARVRRCQEAVSPDPNEGGSRR